MDDLRELLENFQRAYAERDLTRAEEWIRDVFVEEEPVYFGTSPAEECLGAGRILRLIGYQWTVWGQLMLDFDSLIRRDCGEAAGFVLTGYVDWEVSEEAFLSRAMMDVKDLVLRGGEAAAMLHELNTLSSKMLMEASRGTRHVLPVRLSGMAVRCEDGRMRFAHLHLSHPTQNYPDCRIERH